MEKIIMETFALAAQQLLLSFLPPSHMVASERISANTSFSFDLNSHNIPQEPSIGILMDMEVNTPRDWSSSSKTNSSRETSVFSNASFMTFVDRVQALAIIQLGQNKSRLKNLFSLM